ncbi:hypothetical protein [Parablautia intestinalis]|jgi:hypothetical protein|uniref:hypothetical protein n=1 Tax=Parablautia intestinalis TaxID=2320100 RepID=UPI00259D0C2D|nr:hypothetical protein [Parablautia intestinalis]
MMDPERFDEIKNRIIGSERERSGIGTLKEKTVHAVLKDYYASGREMQEISLDGYVADIYTGTEIIEIQTANFNRMRSKLDKFLPKYPVTIVYPIPKIKYLVWMDEETGECSKPRKSTVKGSVYRAFYELYKIKPYLANPNLHLCFPFLELEEYRLLNGWSQDKKRGSCRYDRIPKALLGEMRFDQLKDYTQLIPPYLAEPFTVVEFGKAVKEQKQIAGMVLHILNYLKVIERCENRGRSYTYRIINSDNLL